MEQHVHELSVHQRRQGAEVVQAISRGALPPEHGFQVLRGWPILRIRPRALRDLLFYSAVLIGVHLRQIRVDVVHIHGDWSAFLFGPMLKSVARARLLVGSVHSRVPESRWRRAIFRRCVGRYQLLYATGARESELLTRWSEKQWHWIASGISEHFLELRADSVKTTDVVIVGSLVARKGLDLAIEIARRMPQRTFQIIGDGPERSKLVSLVSQGRVGNLRFLGRLEPSAVAVELAQSRVLLVTSLEEGTPTAMLEAMAAGLPIVTTSSNDYLSLLGEGEGGVIVETRDSQQLARAIERFVSDAPLARQVGERNRQVAARFAWPNVADRITQAMETALAKSCRP